jgi:hypothetical protein
MMVAHDVRDAEYDFYLGIEVGRGHSLEVIHSIEDHFVYPRIDVEDEARSAIVVGEGGAQGLPMQIGSAVDRQRVYAEEELEMQSGGWDPEGGVQDVGGDVGVLSHGHDDANAQYNNW